MPQFELRIYTLTNAEAATNYMKIWDRHVSSLAKHGITTHFYSLGVTDPTQVVALVSYEDGVDPDEATKKYMSNEEFKDDMRDYDIGHVKNAESKMLTRVTGVEPIKL